MPFHALQWGYATYTSGFPFNFTAAISDRERATTARAGLNHFFALRLLVASWRLASRTRELAASGNFIDRRPRTRIGFFVAQSAFLIAVCDMRRLALLFIGVRTLVASRHSEISEFPYRFKSHIAPFNTNANKTHSR